jgi:hypothetical protein
VLILSDPSEWYMSLFRGANKVSGTIWNGGVYTVAVSDLYNNRPPAGSTIVLEASGDCEVLSPSTGEVTVNNTTAYGAFSFELQTGGVGTTGSLDITLTPTDGTPYTQTFNCIPQPPPDPNDGGLTTGG